MELNNAGHTFWLEEPCCHMTSVETGQIGFPFIQGRYKDFGMRWGNAKLNNNRMKRFQWIFINNKMIVALFVSAARMSACETKVDRYPSHRPELLWQSRSISGRHQRAFKKGEQRICGYQMKASGSARVTQTCYARWVTSGAMDLILSSPVVTLSSNADPLFNLGPNSHVSPGLMDSLKY